MVTIAAPFHHPATGREKARQTQCAGKQGFANGAQAHKHLARIKKERRSGGRTQRTYRCDHCGQFHLGIDSTGPRFRMK